MKSATTSVSSIEPALEQPLAEYVAGLYERHGQRKEMGLAAASPGVPHFYLLRTFLGETDLLVIFNTKRCRYRCAFCQLPAKSSAAQIPDRLIIEQFRYVVTEIKDALSIIERVTISNDGSVLDASTFGVAALSEILTAVSSMRRVRRIELETRLEFATTELLTSLKLLVPRARIGILSGFETLDQDIRDSLLRKQESVTDFLKHLDKLAYQQISLTAYVLFKPDPAMSDQEACQEAQDTISFLVAETSARDIPLTVRLNPMYRAVGSRWASIADMTPAYQPPRLTDVMRVAEWARKQDVPVYIGLSAEGLSDDRGTYAAREDYSIGLIRHIKVFNDGKIPAFPWDELESPRSAARR